MKTLTRLAGTLLVVMAGGLLTGCTQCPTESANLDTIVSQYNANAKAVNSFASNAKISGIVSSSRGFVSFGGLFSGNNGKVFFARGSGSADYFALILKEASRPAFWLGVNPDEQVYYVWYQVGGKDGAWFGNIRMAGAPGQDGMPIDPMGVGSLLGFAPLPAGDGLPGVGMKKQVSTGFDALIRKPCAYVLTCHDRQPVTGRDIPRREIYFHWTGPNDDFTQPYQVVFLSAEGRPMMKATLSDYKSVPGAMRADGKPAVMPTNIVVQSVSGSGMSVSIDRMEIRLTDPSEGDPKAAANFQDNCPPTLIERARSVDQSPLPANQKGTE